MQDIDDFDPLDDILLSDEEPPDPKVSMKNKSFIYQKPKEITAVDDLFKEDRKKKMLAELFGTTDQLKEKPKQLEEISIPPTKSDWLDLKSETKSGPPESTSSKTVTWQTPTEKSSTFTNDIVKKDSFGEKLSASENDDMFDTSQSQATTVRIIESLDRRKSESSARSDGKKSKQRFKSLDLDLDFDFDKSSEHETSKKKNIQENEERKVENNVVPGFRKEIIKTTDESVKRNTKHETVDRDIAELFYVPSTGNRRAGTSTGRSQIFDASVSSSLLVPDHSQNAVNSDTFKDPLPTWLEPKKPDVRPFSSSSRTDKSDGEKLRKNDETISGENTSKPNYNFLREVTNIRIGDNSESDTLSTVLELKRKQEELKNIVKIQTSSLIRHEQEIQQSAVKLMLQHRNNINALMQIISPGNMNDDLNEKLGDEKNKIGNFENTVSQLQEKLIQQEFEKNELQLKLEYAEKKYFSDLVALEDLYAYKLQVAKEKESHLKKEIQNLDEEYNFKLQRKKENEEEIIRSYKEKIRIMQDEHLNEVKYISDYREAKSSRKESKAESNSDNVLNEKAVSKELTVKEMALEDKEKELLEWEEKLSKKKLVFEGKSVELKTRMEELEVRIAKEKIAVEQQKKDLKLSQLIFEEKETSWGKEKQREKEYLCSYKQEIETMKENLLKEEKKIMKEKFELSAEKARIEVILNLDGNSGQLGNVLLNKAELQASFEEVNRLKEKLHSEREEIKKESQRLKEESWKLKEIEQQLLLQNKHYQKLLNESEIKREEGIQALKKAQIIESQMNDRIEDIENRLSNLKKKEEQLTHDKIELSKERDLVNKKRYHLDMVLPELTYEEQLPFNIMNRSLIDPKILIMKWKTENDMDSLFGL